MIKFVLVCKQIQSIFYNVEWWIIKQNRINNGHTQGCKKITTAVFLVWAQKDSLVKDVTCWLVHFLGQRKATESQFRLNKHHNMYF